MIPVFLTMCLDFISVGIVVPILAPFFLDSGSFSNFTQAEKTIMLGFLIGSFPIATFFGAPILGAWSDKIGRKKILLGTLFVTFLCNLVFAFGISLQNIFLLFLSRIIAGLAGGNINVCAAALVDITKKEDRAKMFGLLGLSSFAFGTVLGPLLGGYLSSPSISSFFNVQTPIFATALLALLNFFLTFFIFKETLKAKVTDKKIRILSAIENFPLIFASIKLRSIFLISFLITFGFNFFGQFFQVFLVQKFKMDINQIANITAFLGIMLAISQGLIVRLIPSKLSAQKVLLLSLPMLFIFFPLLVFPKNIGLIYFLVALIALFQGLVWPFSSALISSLADEKEQGEVLGINASLTGLAIGIPPILASFLAVLNINIPFILAGLLALIAWIILLRSFSFNRAIH